MPSRARAFSSGDGGASDLEKQRMTETSPPRDGSKGIDDDALPETRGVRPPFLETTLTDGSVSASNVSEKLVEGMDVEELIARLDTDGDGRVNLDDFQAFLLKIALPVKSLAPLATGKDMKEQSEDACRTGYHSESYSSGESGELDGLELRIKMSAAESPNTVTRMQSRSSGLQCISRVSLAKYQSNAKGRIGEYLARELAGETTHQAGGIPSTTRQSADQDHVISSWRSCARSSSVTYERSCSRVQGLEATHQEGDVSLLPRGSTDQNDSYNNAATDRLGSITMLNRFGHNDDIEQGYSPESSTGSSRLEGDYENTVTERGSAPSRSNSFDSHILQSQHSAQASDVSLGASNAEASASNGVADSSIVTATSQWTKQRSSPVPNDVEIGAMQVDEQAPQLNRRFFRGLNRPSIIAARRRIRSRARVSRVQVDVNSGEGSMQGQGLESDNIQARRTPRLSSLLSNSGIPSFAITATLVEENEGEVVMAERVSFFERKWKGIAFSVFILLVILVVSLSMLLNNGVMNAAKESGMIILQEDVPSMQPSSPPSFDSRPTVEIVQARGHVRCGLSERTIVSAGGLRTDLCRAVAAVLFGNPDNIVKVLVMGSTRFQMLSDKTVDVLIYGDTRTVEREVRERTSGAGFTFSSTYQFDGMAYFGDRTLVRCAEKRRRYNECSSLLICAIQGSTSYDFVQSSFPSDFYTVGSSLDEVKEMLLNGTCNIIALDRSALLHMESVINTTGRNFMVGDKLMTKEPLAIVTRNHDAEFLDAVNWVVQSLFYGEEQGLTKDLSKCQSYTGSTMCDVSDLIFSNAFYCVGHYGQILGEGYQNNRGMNRINDGTTGMLYATPFGELEQNTGVQRDTDAEDDGALLGIRNKGSLNCGVVVPTGFTGQLTASTKLVGMSAEYCHTLAAALYNGNYEAVTILSFSGEGNSSFVALNDGTIDVLAGARVEQKYDFRSSSSAPFLGGFHFSTPYYYGNETAIENVSFFSLATRDYSGLFSSFVNCVVLATIFVAEKIREKESAEIPLVSIFGSEFNWALKDAIAYSGSYDQIYKENFGDTAEEDRDRNRVNDEGTPQMHSFPGIRQWQS